MTSDDLRETIARLRKLHESGRAWATDQGGDWQDVPRLERDIWKTLPMILDAAEAARTMFTVEEMGQLQTDARNAALEEAAKVADRLAIHASDADLQSDDDSDCYGAGYNCGACEYGVQIAEEIRALKEPT